MPDTATTVSTTHQVPNSLSSWTIAAGVANPSSQVTTLGSTAGSWTETATRPDNTYTLTTYAGGLLSSVQQYAPGSPATLITETEYTYDGLNRQLTSVDSRTGTTTTAYRSNTCDSVASVTDPGSRVTSYEYDSRGRIVATTLPDHAPPGHSSVTRASYLPSGQVAATWGSQTYPTFTEYDYAGRRLTLHTKPDLDGNGVPTGGGSLTTWNYSTTTGRLTSKLDDSSNGPSYTYTNAGRLQTRTWARGVVTTYGYAAGRMTSVVYTDDPANTPALGFTYHRFGPISQVTRGGAAHASYTYDSALRLTAEALNQDTLAKTIQRNQDDILRPLSVEVSGDYTVGYGHDAAGRLNRVWHLPSLDATTKAPQGNPSFTYSWQSGSYGLVAGVAGPAHTVTNTWAANRDLLTLKENKVGATTVSSYAYGVNALGQREAATTAGTAFATAPQWAWAYNPRGELVEANDTSAANNDRAYQFDDIGNREKTVNGLLANLPATPNYSANTLNQYTVANGVTLPVPAHDTDGNYTNGPVPAAPAANATLDWDAENRLLTITKANGDVIAFDYDYLGRRASKAVTPSGGSAVTTRFLYDGWNLIAEYAGTTLAKTHTWGLDLSWSQQGAGGVGGLLAVSIRAGSGTGNYFPSFDGNGNVSEYLDDSGNIAAHFEYDPFGRALVDTDTNGYFSIRFSTKYLDSESGLYYYGFRFYDPLTGRWPSRDPIGEAGGLNLHAFVTNNSTNFWDILGRKWFANGSKHTNIILTRGAGGFVLDGRGDYEIKIFRPWGQTDLRTVEARKHEGRHISTLKASTDARAVPHKQVFCTSKDGKSWFFEHDGTKLKSEPTQFNLGKDSSLWDPGVAPKYVSYDFQRTDEMQELETEIKNLRTPGNAATASEQQRATDLGTMRDHYDNHEVPGNIGWVRASGITPDWTEFELAHIRKIAEAKENGEFVWRFPDAVYVDLKKLTNQ